MITFKYLNVGKQGKTFSVIPIIDIYNKKSIAIEISDLIDPKGSSTNVGITIEYNYRDKHWLVLRALSNIEGRVGRKKFLTSHQVRKFQLCTKDGNNACNLSRIKEAYYGLSHNVNEEKEKKLAFKVRLDTIKSTKERIGIRPVDNIEFTNGSDTHYNLLLRDMTETQLKLVYSFARDLIVQQ